MKNRIVFFLVLMLIGNEAWSQILVPFVKRYDVTQAGGLVMLGNTMLTCSGSSGACTSGRAQVPPTGTAKDNDFNSAYIDIDGIGSTFSSSSADLNLSTCSKITFAGLYWGAYINTGNGNYNQRNQVKIKTPSASGYTTLTADEIYDLNNGYDYYTCFKDITSIMENAGNGTFTLADLVARTGGTNQWAGWGIVVVYKNELMPAKNFNVFDGLGYVTNSGSSVTVNLNGFYTPPSGAVNFELGEIAFDGDRALTGDSLLFRGNASFLSVSDGLHYANDIFNSSITTNGVEQLNRNPAYSNTLGYDQCIFRPNNAAKNYLANGATSAQIKVTTGGEQIYLRVLTSAIDTYEPELAMQKTVSDVNGGIVNPGDTLLYTISITNKGNDTSITTLITDTLPFNAEYVAGSTIITSGPNTGVKTDVAGDDQAEMTTSAGYQILTIRLGTGANGTSGGQMPHVGAGSTTSLSFRVKITDDCTKLLCDPVISNRANVNYSGFISGFPRRGKSNPVLVDSLGCPVEGATNTNIAVPVSCAPAPDSSIGGCLPIVFSTIPGIRPGYSYYNSSWVSVTSATVTGNYYGIRQITGTTCADTIRYTVYVISPTSSNAGPDQNLCNVTNSTMAGNTPSIGTGTWLLVSGPNTPTFSSPNSPGSAITGLVTGTYVIVWRISTGCTNSSDTMLINNSPLPVTSNAGANQNLCNVTSTSLAANSPGAGTGLWTLVSGPNTPAITTPTSQSSTVTGMIAGVYVFRWSISRGVCTPSSSTVQVTISALPSGSNAGPDQNICNVTSATLSGNNPLIGSGNWTLVSGPNTPTISAPGLANTGVTGMVAGVYIFRWTITNGTCTPTTDDIQITIFSLSTISNAGPDQNLCNVTSTTLAGNSPGPGTGVWTFVSGPNSPVITAATSPTSTVTGMTVGVYVLRWTITNGVCAPSNDDVQITIFALPSTSNAGPDQNLCNVNSTVLAANNPAVGSGTWVRISGPNTPTITTPSSPTSSLTGMISGVYVYRWVVTNGVCASSNDDVQITIFSLPTTAAAGTDQSLCNVTTATLSGNNPVIGTGNWTLVSGPNVPAISSPGSSITNVINLINGVYVFRWTISNGPCSASTDDVQIIIYQPSSTSNAGPDQNLCNVNSTSLAANVPAAGSGVWSLVSGPNVPGIVSPASNASSVTGLITGVYVFRWTITNGVCASSSDDVQVRIYALPTTSNAGADQSLCNVNSTVLAANSPLIGNGLWSLVSGPNTPTIVSASNPASGVTGMVTGVYIFRWTITEGVCSPSFDDVQVTIFALPTVANAGPDQNPCNVSSITFSGNNPVIGSGAWTLLSGPNVPVITNPASRNSTVTGMIAGVYVFRWTINNGVCAASTDDVQITNYALPSVADAGTDQGLCNVSSATLAATAPAVGSGLWTLISGPNLPTITATSNPGSTVTGMTTGVYVFRWTTTNGTCAGSTDDVQITIFALPTNSNAGLDQNLCNVSTTTLAGNDPAIGTGTWTQLSGPNVASLTTPGSYNSTVTGMIPGVYVFQWSVVSGVCAASTDDVQVTIYSLPDVSNAGVNQSLCNVSSTTMSANTPVSGSGLWSLVSGPNTPVITTASDPASGITVMIAGVYVFRWTISNGVCANSVSDVSITIFENPTIANAGADDDVCSVTSITLIGNTPVTGSGNWTLVSGPNTPVIVSPTNPTSLVTGMIDGAYTFSWTISNGVCPPSTSNTNVTIWNLPTTTDAGPDQFLCNVNSATMAGNVPAFGFGTWSFISGPNVPVITTPNDPATGLSGLVIGTYRFGWRITNGPCSGPVDTVQIIIYDLPTTSNAGANQDLCSVTSISLNGNTPTVGSGLWTFQSGPNIPVITNPALANTTVTGMIDGTYVFEWAITNGVCASSTSTVQVTIYNSPTLIDAGPDQSLCNVSSTVMSANIPAVGTGTWIQLSGPGGSSIVSPNDPATSITGMTAGIYLFGWSISNGVCVTPVDTVRIDLFDLPTVSNAGLDQNLCNVDSSTMSANLPAIGTGRWIILSGPNTPVIADTSNPATKISSLISGTYQFIWSISNGVCSVSNDTVQVTIYSLPTISNAGPDQSVCNISTVSMSANAPSTGNGTWSLISGPNAPLISNNVDPLTSVSGLIPGAYVFAWTISSGVCTISADSITVNVYALPTVANAGPDQNLCNTSSGSFAANTAISGNGIWSLLSGPNTPSIAVPSNPASPVSGLIQGTYLFVWTINNGVCSASRDTVLINVYDLPTVADAGTDQELCGSTSVNLAANTPVNGNGMWTLTSGPNVPAINNASDPNTNVSSLVPGVYVFNWSISSGTCTLSDDEVEVTIYEYPPFIDAGSNQFLCNVSSVSLSGNVGSVGTSYWSFLSGPNTPTISSPSSPSTNVTGMVPGIYSFSLNIVNGVCAVHSDTIQISIDALPSAAVAGPDQDLCNVASLTMTANDPISGTAIWNLISGPNIPVIVYPDSGSTPVNGLIPGSYVFSWTISNGVCSSSSDTIIATIYADPLSVDAGSDQSLCNTYSTTMAGNVPSSGIGTWSLMSGPVLPVYSSVNDPFAGISGLVAGTFVFGWQINNGVCATNIDTVLISVYDLPTVANAGPDQDLCNDSTTVLNANNITSGLGVWTQLSGPNTALIVMPDNPSTQIEGLTYGIYEFVWTVSNGSCATSSDTMEVRIYNSPIASDAGPNQSLCINSVLTMAANAPGAGVGTWTLISGPNVPVIADPNDQVTTVNGLTAGIYVFRWTISNNLICADAFDDVQIEIYDLPTVAVAGSAQILCDVYNISLTANTPLIGVGTWMLVSGPNNPSITSPGNPSTTVVGLEEGVYVFSWNISSGVCTVSSDNVQISIDSLPTVASAGADQDICLNTAMNLLANNPSVGNGVWTLLNGPNVPVINSPNSPVASASGFIEGVYNFIWTISNGSCAASSDTVQITVFDSPDIASAGTYQYLCSVDTITLDANVPVNGVGRWTLISGPNAPLIFYPDSAHTDVAGIAAGIYIFRWTISNGVCSDNFDDVRVVVNTLPLNTFAGPDQNLCESDSAILTGSTPAVGTGAWVMVYGPSNVVIATPGNESTTVTGLVQGVYEFRWTVVDGVCSSHDNVLVTLNPPPIVSVSTHSFTTCEGRREVQLQANGAFSYTWSPSFNLSNTGIYNPTVLIQDSMVYVVVGTDVNGCSASDTVIIEVCDYVVIPSGFSPDGDGVNDFFEIVGISRYPNNNLKIFNRWGNILYKKDKYDNSWNGTPNVSSLILGSSKVPEGTYYYILDLGIAEKPKAGYLIIRY